MQLLGEEKDFSSSHVFLSFLWIDGWNWVEVKVRERIWAEAVLQWMLPQTKAYEVFWNRNQEENSLSDLRSSPWFLYIPALFCVTMSFAYFFAIAFISLFYNDVNFPVPLRCKLLETGTALLYSGFQQNIWHKVGAYINAWLGGVLFQSPFTNNKHHHFWSAYNVL